jgi:hypothetical protein
MRIYLPFPYVFVMGCIIRHKGNITFNYFNTVLLRVLSEMRFGPSPPVHIVKTWSGCGHVLDERWQHTWNHFILYWTTIQCT